jgi:hypothetical protein
VAGIATDVRSLDPAAYAQAIRLQPEDCYGFLPLDHDDITPYLFLYRDRPEYEQARAGLPAPQRVKNYGPVRVEPTQTVEIDVAAVPGVAQGDFGGVLEAAQRMAEGSGAAGFGSSTGQPAATGPDPEKLARLDRLRASGAINEQEYMKLAADALGTMPGAGPPPGEPDAAGSGGRIVAHRMYPRLHRRASTRQLNYFLPRYREALGLRSDDVYGVLPRRTRWSVSGDYSTKEWDDFWIVYRDRPEYEQGRAAWAQEMDKGGGWPEVMVSPGVGEPRRLTHDQGGGLEVEKEGWPRHKLVMRETGTELGDSLRAKIEDWGYTPEDSLGFCPNYPNRSIYFAWRTP